MPRSSVAEKIYVSIIVRTIVHNSCDQHLHSTLNDIGRIYINYEFLDCKIQADNKTVLFDAKLYRNES